MRSLELALVAAATVFAVGMLVVASFPYHLLTVESPSARMEMVEGH